MSLEITSSAFSSGESIPAPYTCDGEDVSPPLEWRGSPEQTRSFVLIMDDPDAPAGTWDHWILFNIPAESRSLAKGVPKTPELADGSRHGRNSWGRSAYGGPCPPGGTHRYYFRLYALATTLDLEPGARKSEVLKAMDSHALAEAELMGRYRRAS